MPLPAPTPLSTAPAPHIDVAFRAFYDPPRAYPADAAGAVYVMDAGNHRVRMVNPEGIVSTLFEVTDPNQTPGNIKLDRAGTIYLSDREHNAIYRLPRRAP